MRKGGRVGRNEGRKEEKGSRWVRLQGPVSVTVQALCWPLTSRDLCRAWLWTESWSIFCWWLGFPWMRGLIASICTPTSSSSSCSTCSRGRNKWGVSFLPLTADAAQGGRHGEGPGWWGSPTPEATPHGRLVSPLTGLVRIFQMRQKYSETPQK